MKNITLIKFLVASYMATATEGELTDRIVTII